MWYTATEPASGWRSSTSARDDGRRRDCRFTSRRRCFMVLRQTLQKNSINEPTLAFDIKNPVYRDEVI